jgi:SAM-dependent methyltransferase
MEHSGVGCGELPIEIHSEDTTAVDAILSKLREKIEMAKRSPRFDRTMSELNSVGEPKGAPAQSITSYDLANDLPVIVQRKLATGKRIVAPLVMWLHRLADAEVLFLMEPTIMGQMNFNSRLVSLLGSLEKSIDEAKFRSDKRWSDVLDSLRRLETQYSGDIQRRISDLEKVQAGISAMGDGLFMNYPVHVEGRRFLVNERIVENAFVLRNIPRMAKRVLDVGCSESYLSIQLAGLGFSVYGIDVQDYRLYHPNLHFLRDDIVNTPFPNEYFDAAIAISTIEHVGLGHYGDPVYGHGDIKAVDEIHRVLRRKGKLIMSAPLGPRAMQTWERIYDEESLRNLLRKFRIERIDCFIKRAEQWLSATMEDVKKLKIDTKTLDSPFPLWPCIALLTATKEA